MLNFRILCQIKPANPEFSPFFGILKACFLLKIQHAPQILATFKKKSKKNITSRHIFLKKFKKSVSFNIHSQGNITMSYVFYAQIQQRKDEQ